MSDEDECTWIALEAATRNVVALLCIRKEKDALSAPSLPAGGSGRADLERVPAALTWEGAGEAAGLASDGDSDGDELRKIG